MKQIFKKFLLIIILFSYSCKNNEGTTNNDIENFTSEKPYDDGTYCADVTYFNPNTQRQSQYTLNVEVDNGKLIKILWSNGGWLDVSHFTPPNISSSGDCSFTSDRGYRYTVSITGSECTSTDNPKAIEGREGNLTRKQCADLYGASANLFNAFLKSSNVLADDLIDNEDCELMHKSLASFERLYNLEEKIKKGYIQHVYTRTSGLGAVCQVIIVKRYGVLYLLEIGQGKATMGLTSFNPNDDNWQEIMIQEKPDEDKWSVVVVRVLTSGTMSDLEELARIKCS